MIEVNNALLLVKTACLAKFWFLRVWAKRGQNGLEWGGGRLILKQKNGKYREFWHFHTLVGKEDLRSLAYHASLSWIFGTKNCTLMIWCEKWLKSLYLTILTEQVVFWLLLSMFLNMCAGNICRLLTRRGLRFFKKKFEPNPKDPSNKFFFWVYIKWSINP